MESVSRGLKVAIAALAFVCQFAHAGIYTVPVNNFTYDNFAPFPTTRAVGTIETSELGVFRGSEIVDLLMRSTYRAELYSGDQSRGVLTNGNSSWQFSCGWRQPCFVDVFATLTVTPTSMTFQYNWPYRPDYQVNYFQLSNWNIDPPAGEYQKTLSMNFRDDFDSLFFDWDAVNRAARPNDVRGQFVFTAQAVPEPSTWLLAVLGLGTLALARVKPAPKTRRI